MSRDPAELLDLAALVALGSELEIDCELESLVRLAPLLRDHDGAAHGRFRFHRVAGAAAAEGRVTATLHVTCQRCMNELAVAVDSACRLVFADTDDVQVPGDDELVVTRGGRISLAELVEEELLLALPLAPMHSEGQGCSIKPAAEAKAAREPKQRPFAGLRELMKD